MNCDFFTPQDLHNHWCGRISLGTLANWRSTGSGPSFTKIGGAILYPREAVFNWERANTVESTAEYSASKA